MEIRLPPMAPDDVLDLADFTDRMNEQMRELRDRSALPWSAATLPEEFEELVATLGRELREQASRAQEAGETLVEVRVPYSDTLAALVRWYEPRMELIVSLTRAGMIQPEWERPLKRLVEVYEAVLAQTGPAPREADGS